jgi:hypothetical protein
MPSLGSDYLAQIDNHLGTRHQSWLFGAGISLKACVPLMWPLTERVREMLNGDASEDLVNLLISDLPSTCHIEHVLSHIGDYQALTERTSKTVQIGGKDFKKDDLENAHTAIVSRIADTIRWGYQADPKTVGKYDAPIVKVDDHRSFIRAALGKAQAGLTDRRRAIRLFSLNYDTLIEDALALESIPYWDGFTGGAVAYRSHRFGENPPDGFYRAYVIKLHGSIDWHLVGNEVTRVRHFDVYPPRTGRVLIYPQATKYVATQRDPFATQFDLFRRTLAEKGENVLSICGYSFGDAHVNQEIEMAMAVPGSRTTLLAFSMKLGPDLERWRNESWGQRLYILTEAGLYVGKEGPYFAPATGKKLDWWTFEGAAKVLSNGAESLTV